MSSDDYQVQNIYRYSRKSYKKNFRRDVPEYDGSNHDEGNAESDHSPRNDAFAMELPSCSCEIDHEGEVASILHKKLPVITLAQRQLQRLREEKDNILCDNIRCCRSMYDLLCVCREILLSQNSCLCAILALIAIAFFIGLLFGAASCGSYLGQFDSPILTCIDNFFIRETKVEEYRGIV